VDHGRTSPALPFPALSAKRRGSQPTESWEVGFPACESALFVEVLQTALVSGSTVVLAMVQSANKTK